MNNANQLLGFGDLIVVAQKLRPAFVNDRMLSVLYRLRVGGLILTLVLLLLVVFFYIKMKPFRKKKEPKTGLSSLNKESLLNEIKWKAVLIKMDEYLKYDNILYWKLALAEIESYFSKALLEIGFRGNDLTERLANVGEHFLANIDDIKLNHNKVLLILNDNNYLLTKDEVGNILDVYKAGMDNLRKL